MQKTDLDFKEKYAPVVWMNSTHLLLTITLHINISNTYLHGEMNIDIYMTQPPEFINTRHPDYICLLNKSLYDIKQVGRIWHATIREHILEMGFTSSTADLCIFVKELENGDCTFIMLHVDDFVCAGLE
jgi:Reverse transcriptase (RNA-dependent DNA polymerase)